MVGRDGDYYTEGAKGVIRLTQVRPWTTQSHLFREKRLAREEREKMFRKIEEGKLKQMERK